MIDDQDFSLIQTQQNKNKQESKDESYMEEEKSVSSSESNVAIPNVVGKRPQVQEELEPYTVQQRKFAVENVGRLLKYFKRYCAVVNMDMTATDEEKIRRKWDVLKCCERDIQIYLDYKEKKAQNAGKKINQEDEFLQLEYRGLKRQVEKQNDSMGKSIVSASDDPEGLSKETMAAIRKIDVWVVRNFRNGGYLSFTGAYCDRTNIVGRLLSMPPRKRLYIYYLIQSRQRVKPTMDGFMTSQITFKPDLKKFKDRMIAHKLKFYKRFSGGYIYWNKLAQAMGIADQAQPLLDNANDLLALDKKKKEEELRNNVINQEIPQDNEIKKENKIKKDNKAANASGLTREDLKLLLSDLITAMLLKNELENGNLSDKDKSERIEWLNILSDKISELLGGLQAEKTAFGDMAKDFAKYYAGDFTKNVNSIVSVALYSIKDPIWGDWNRREKTSFGKTVKNTGIGNMGFGAIASLAGSIFELLSLKEGGKTMNWFEFSAKGLNMFDGIFKATRASSDIARSAGANNEFLTFITSKASWIGTAAADSFIALLNAFSYGRNARNRVKASKLASNILEKKGERDEERFKQGMLELNRRLGARQKKNTAGSTVTAAISSTAAILTSLSVVTVGVSAIAGAISFGVGICLTAMDARESRKMKNALFDSYYKVDEELKKCISDWNERNPGQLLTPEKKLLMKDQLRNKIAAREGFYSPRHGATAIAKKYADYLLEHANNKEDSQSDMCKAMIKGLGLHYKYNAKNKDKSVPKASDIVKKLCK